MIMENRSRRLAEPLRWGRREKVAVGALLVCFALALVGLGVYALASGSRARRDCIDVTFASTVGGDDVNACGAQARRICASGAFPGVREELAVACRRAGFPFHPRS
jgi:hypothetical protein